MTTIALVDDHQLIRDGLRRAVEAADDFELVAEASSLAEARALLPPAGAEVVVVDVRLPDGTGLDLVAELRTADADVGLVVLTADVTDEVCLAALQAGASALVGKDVPAAAVIEAARRAHVSPRNFASRDLNRILRDRNRVTPGAEPPSLSHREQEVMVLAAEGLSAGAIARELNVAESTVKTHLSQIYRKLGATNRAQAVMRAVRSGLLSSTAPAAERSD